MTFIEAMLLAGVFADLGASSAMFDVTRPKTAYDLEAIEKAKIRRERRAKEKAARKQNIL